MARDNALPSFDVSQRRAIAFTHAKSASGEEGQKMRWQILELRRLLLNEAVGREAHAAELAELAVRHPDDMHAPTLRVLAHSQRIRAMELRGRAAALLVCKTPVSRA